ncbi:Ig-like domain-containing protein, partial [Salmonella enterica subsp. enterica serovar Montevideo]|nr:Ig-like domain-containing protein [Salmonella enterica subsp. enterica serovar Montevideo]
VTLAVTVFGSVLFRGFLAIIPILIGVLAGYALSFALGVVDTTLSVPTLSLDSADDSGIAGDNITNVKTPGFTLNNIDTDV